MKPLEAFKDNPELSKAIAETRGEIIMLGMSDADMISRLRNYCRNGGRLLHTYTDQQHEAERWKDKQGKYHKVTLLTQWETVGLVATIVNGALAMVGRGPCGLVICEAQNEPALKFLKPEKVILIP